MLCDVFVLAMTTSTHKQIATAGTKLLQGGRQASQPPVAAVVRTSTATMPPPSLHPKQHTTRPPPPAQRHNRQQQQQQQSKEGGEGCGSSAAGSDFAFDVAYTRPQPDSAMAGVRERLASHAGGA